MVQHLISSFLQRKLFPNACYKGMRNRSISICNLVFILATYFWLEKCQSISISLFSSRIQAQLKHFQNLLGNH